MNISSSVSKTGKWQNKELRHSVSGEAFSLWMVPPVSSRGRRTEGPTGSLKPFPKGTGPLMN